MLLSYTEICELIERGVIEFAEYENVNSSSLDIRLGPTILQEIPLDRLVSLKDKDKLPTVTRRLPYILDPGEFVLAQSHEVFHLPNNISAEFKLKSSSARIGIEHLNAGWCDAGWNGSVLTMEIKNMTLYSRIILHHMDKIGQLVFFRHTLVPKDKSYAVRGRYNNDLTVQGNKR